MAAASYTTDLSDLTTTPDSGEATSNWNALGGGASGLNVETDYFLQGANCVSKNAWAGAEKGMIEDTTNNTLTASSGKAVYTWVTHTTPGSLGTKAQGGICILLGSAANTYNEYDYAGSDTIDYGAPWICAVVDPDNATATTGTVTTANMDCYGATANLPTTGPTKGAPFGIDVIRYGRTIEIAGGDGADADATFTGVASANDATTARWGQFQRTPGSSTNFTMQCRLEFGKTTATSSACTFTDSNKNITINDLEYTATGFIEFDVTQASTVDISNCNFTATTGANTKGNWVSTSSTSVDLTGCSFTNMGTFGFDANTTIEGCTFRNCNTLTQSSATIDGSIITNSAAAIALTSTPTTIGSLGANSPNTFVGDGTTTPGHAVDMGTYATTGTVNWYNILDNGVTNASEWEGSTQAATAGPTGDANAAIKVNVTSGNALKISVAAGATIPTVYNTGTGTVEITANEVTLTITVKDINTGGVLQGAMVYCTNLAETATYINKVETNASGQVSFTGSLSTAQTLAGSVRAASPGSKAYTKYYKSSPIAGTFSNTADTDITIQLIPDE